MSNEIEFFPDCRPIQELPHKAPDPLKGKMVSFKEASQIATVACGRPVSDQVIRTWAKRGLRGVVLPSDKRVALRVTSVEALEWFFAKVDQAEWDAAPTIPRIPEGV